MALARRRGRRVSDKSERLLMSLIATRLAAPLILRGFSRKYQCSLKLQPISLKLLIVR
jgi:hypothetical protein